VLVALAELLRDRAPAGLRVLLVSCGAEETLQDGIRAFMARHACELPRGRTFALNYDTVGSPHLVMIEAEGPFWMEAYPGAYFRDLVADCARSLGISLERGLRARASTDSIITARAGHPTATLGSITDWRGIANYHLPSDVPENLDHDTIVAAARLGHATAVELAKTAA
jgi:Zn-dependent M28 family amino/carboxypeptidase